MREMIGLWLIALAISSGIIFLEPAFYLKDKILFVIGFIIFITLLFARSWLIAGC